MSFQPKLHNSNIYTMELIKRLEWSDFTDVNEVVTGLNGDIDEIYYLRFQVWMQNLNVQTWPTIVCYFNSNSTTSLYQGCVHIFKVTTYHSVKNDNPDFQVPVIALIQNYLDSYCTGYAQLYTHKDAIKTYMCESFQWSGFDGRHEHHHYFISAFNSTNNVTSLLFKSHGCLIKGYVELYRQVPVINLSPYKVKVLEKDNVNQINGLSIPVSSKKLMIEYTCSGNPSSDIQILANNDTSNYQSGSNLLTLQANGETNIYSKAMIIPQVQLGTIEKYSDSGYVEDKNRYTNGDITTIDFVAPSDDIECKLTVWEITD